jgi:signal transduction histidine kinase
MAGGEGSPPVEVLQDMRAEVRQLLADLRQVCAALRPPMLDALGLGAALRALAEDWSAQCGVPVHFDLPPNATLRSLPGEVAVNLYRVVQEALANVARHAAAQRVSIRLAWEGTRLVLTVQDDGQGFVVPADFHSLTAQGHFGLVGMQERVDLIGGTWMVESTPGQGTTVRVVKNADFRTSTD